ncbi:KilA-N domain-containing protein, partial [Xanthomonas citri pv. citri]|nr:KilA-N domain-containing protein [Xanthomonas citri pv. citri]
RDDNPKKSGNIRDNATLYQLLVLANMESYNAIMIKQGKTQVERMNLLHELAVQQMTSLSGLELNDLPEINKK